MRNAVHVYQDRRSRSVHPFFTPRLLRPRWSSRPLWQLALLCAFYFVISIALPGYAQNAPSDKVGLNFVGADIDSVVSAVGQYTNTTFIIDPRVRGTINLVSDGPVTREQAMRLLTSSLRLQGFVVVPGDGFSKVVPEADAKLQAASMPSHLRGDQIATQIFRLNYESAANLVPMLRPLISPNNTISANPGNNTLIVTDYGDNLRRIGKIIASLDLPVASEPEVIPIRYAMAVDIAVMINRLMEPVATVTGANAQQQGGGENGRFMALADPRTNSVILRAPSVARANLAKSLIAKLDLPTAQAGNVHVVPLRNAEAIELARTLRAVVLAGNVDTQGAAETQPVQQQPAGQAQTQLASANTLGTSGAVGTTDNSTLMNNAPLNSTPKQTLSAGGPAGFIQADPSTNSLIITASEAVYRNLRTVIDQLDARRAQVFVESLIVEVTSDKAAEFGFQWAGLSGDSNSRTRVGGLTGFTTPGGGSNLITQLVNNANGGDVVSPGNGLTLGVIRQAANGRISLGVIARALQSDADTNILSMPNLITLDNEEARIIVGQNVPFITGQYTTQASGGSSGVNPFQTIERKDVGLSLRIRPQVSEGGTVRMQIYQETSSVLPTTNASDIITNKRSIETNVLVNDGEIVVLGGLLEDSVADTEEKVPGLGDIPIVGNLFKYRNRSRTKTNLMIFLRPTVIRTNEQSVNVAGDRYDLMRNIEIGATPKPSWIMPDTGAPVLPPLQDGRPQGGRLLQRNAPLMEPAPEQAPAGEGTIVPTAPARPLNLPASPPAAAPAAATGGPPPASPSSE
jgi:general secretion pathway protein D